MDIFCLRILWSKWLVAITKTILISNLHTFDQEWISNVKDQGTEDTLSTTPNATSIYFGFVFILVCPTFAHQFRTEDTLVLVNISASCTFTSLLYSSDHIISSGTFQILHELICPGNHVTSTMGCYNSPYKWLPVRNPGGKNTWTASLWLPLHLVNPT